MKPSVILKLVLLVMMLVGVVWATRSMNEQSAAKFFAAFGAPGATSGSEPKAVALGAGDSKYNVCKTRVRAVVWPDGRRIEESKTDIRARWMAVDPQSREINGLDVEKWFSRHCEIVVRESGDAKTATDGFGNYVTFEFIDGTKTDFLRNEKGVIRADERQFVSPDFDAAVAELVSLAQLQPVGP